MAVSPEGDVGLQADHPGRTGVGLAPGRRSTGSRGQFELRGNAVAVADPASFPPRRGEGKDTAAIADQVALAAGPGGIRRRAAARRRPGRRRVGGPAPGAAVDLGAGGEGLVEGEFAL